MIEHADRPREDNFGHSSKRYRVIFTFVLLALAWLSLTTSSVANENWPQFRGSGALGVVDLRKGEVLTIRDRGHDKFWGEEGL